MFIQHGEIDPSVSSPLPLEHPCTAKQIAMTHCRAFSTSTSTSFDGNGTTGYVFLALFCRDQYILMWTFLGLPPHQCLYASTWIEAAQPPWLPSWSGVAPEVNLRNLLHAGNGTTLALKARAGVTRSPKQGYQWPLKRLMSIKNKFLKMWRNSRNLIHQTMIQIKEVINF